MPLVSIIILNYNGEKWNQKCLDSVFSQTYKDFEVIFVDNASTDSSLSIIKNKLSDKRLKIIESGKNLGFAGGNNLGVENSNGEYIIFLNNDTWIEDSFIENCLSIFQKYSYDILGVTELDYNGNKVGDKVMKIDPFGHPTFLENMENHIISEDIFFTSGVALICKKDFYIKTGGLDNDFFMYVEEVDWMWRARLLGAKIGQINNLYVHHAGAGSSGTGIKYNVFLWRNQNTLQMILKNYAWYNLLWTLPIYLSVNIAEIIAFTLFGKFDIAKSYILGWIFNFKNIKRTLTKRGKIQRERKVGDGKIIKSMYHGFGKLNHLVHYFR